LGRHPCAISRTPPGPAPAFTERTGAANPFDGVNVGDFGKPSFADLDGDGDLDVIAGGNDGTLRYFLNTGAGFTQVVNVTAQNDTPVANAQSVGTDKDTAVAVTLSGSDVDGYSLAFTVLSGPAHGTLSAAARTAPIRPPPVTRSGSFSYVVNDGTLNSAPASVSRNVHLNIAPAPRSTIRPRAGSLQRLGPVVGHRRRRRRPAVLLLGQQCRSRASGHFTVNGVVLAANTCAVTAAQLAQTTFTAGQLSDGLFVNAWDVSLFSGPQEFHVNVAAKRAPTGAVGDF
jgi:hypothetical protein